jgi:hypothetical protein
MKKIQITISLTAIAVLLITACKREPKEIDKDTTPASDNAMAERFFNEIKTIADQAYSGTLSLYKSTQDTLVFGCATVIRDTLATPKTITVDFGATNCLCNDNKTRRGKIIITYTGMYRDSGTVITHIPQNYFVNDNQITGQKIVTNKGRNNNGNLWYEISVNGTIIKANNGGTVSWNSTRQRVWISGENTLFNWLDDEYLITGSANGTQANGNTFVITITSPLKVKLNCWNIVSGAIKISPQGKSDRLIDYGSGTCDNQATVTINGNTYNITLP